MRPSAPLRPMFQDLISILDGVNAIFLDLVFNGTANFAIVLVPLAAGRIWTDGSLTPPGMSSRAA
jgi:hypothetical protein